MNNASQNTPFTMYQRPYNNTTVPPLPAIMFPKLLQCEPECPHNNAIVPNTSANRNAQYGLISGIIHEGTVTDTFEAILALLSIVAGTVIGYYGIVMGAFWLTQ